MRNRKRVRQLLLSVGSAAATGAVLALFFPPLLVGIALTVIIAHELGHALIGFLCGGAVTPPIFVPLGFFIVGITRVQDLTHSQRMWVARAGPLAGLGAALGLLLVATVGQIPGMVVAASAAVAFEVYALTLGSDGRRARKEKQWASFSS